MLQDAPITCVSISMTQSKIVIGQESGQGLHSSCPLCSPDETEPRKDSDITVQLAKEHKEITRSLEQLNVARSASPRRFSELTNSLDAHFKKEEQLLFPLLTRALGPFVCDKLSFEHKEMISAARYLSKENGEKTPIANLERQFLTHIATEENVLFWYLDIQHAIEK